MELKSIAASFAAAAAAIGAAIDASATTYYVKPDGDDSAAGTSWATALRTPNKGFEKIRNATANHEVVIAAGTYDLADACACAGPYPSSGNRVFVRGETGHPEDVVLKGNDTFEIMRLSRCITVSDLTISNGSNRNRANQAAGVRVGGDDEGLSIVSNCIVTACYNAYTNGTLSADNKTAMFGGPVYVYPNGFLVDCVVSNNSSIYYGCGVTLDGASATALRCRIEGNVATETENSGVPVLGVKGGVMGGGRLVDCTVQSNRTAFCAGARDVAMVEGSTFRGNVIDPNMAQAHSSSAMSIWTAGVVVTNCTFADNHADNGYATIMVSQPNVSILDSRFIGNSVGSYGGAIAFAVEESGASTLSDCTFDGNSVSQSSNKGGGAIRVDAGNVNVANCLFANNTAPYGGAVDVVWGDSGTRSHVAFTNCQFVGNTARACGGGVRVAKGAQVLFDDCKIVGNSTTLSTDANNDNNGGGGVFLHDQQAGGWCVASNSVFAGNVSAERGGGMGNSWNFYAFGELMSCVFTNNTAARQGGGFSIRENDSHRHDDPFVVRNSLFAFNRTIGGKGDANGAGVLFVTYNNAILDSCTIVSNDCGHTMNGGVHHRWGGSITNCIIAFNTVKGSPEPVTTSSSGAWSMDASCYQHSCIYPGVPSKFTAANGCVNADPKFTDAANGDFTLKSSSPCRDAGMSESWMADATDLAGSARVFGDRPDMGCYEYFSSGGFVISVR